MTKPPPHDDDAPRDEGRLARAVAETDREDIDQKLMDAHERAEVAEARATGTMAALRLERLAHARTKVTLWLDRYNNAAARLAEMRDEVDRLEKESRG